MNIRAAQRGVLLSELVRPRRRVARAPQRAARAARRRAVELRPFRGRFLAPGSLSHSERLRLIDGIERVIDGVFTHLPLKRARYGFDPVQRLRILRTQVDDLLDDAFHAELAAIITSLRDGHTRYSGPSQVANKAVVLPFMLEMAGTPDNPTYIVTHVGPGLDRSFRRGVVVEFWSGMPIYLAVLRYSDHEAGGSRHQRVKVALGHAVDQISGGIGFPGADKSHIGA